MRIEDDPAAALGLLRASSGPRYGSAPLGLRSRPARNAASPASRPCDVVAEPGPRRGLHAVGAAAEVHGVEVAGEDLLLGDLLLELDRHHRFLDLAGGGLLGREVRLLHVLLGDGGAALADALAPDVAVRGPGDAHGVDAAVLEEVPVLGGQHGVAQHRRDLVVGDQDAVLGAVELGHGVGRRCSSTCTSRGADERGLLLDRRHLGVDRAARPGRARRRARRHRRSTASAAR